MAVAFRALGTPYFYPFNVANPPVLTNMSVRIPTCQVGDLLLLFATCGDPVTGNPTVPAGWTLVTNSGPVSGTAECYVWQKRAVAGDSGNSIIVGLNGGNTMGAGAFIAAYDSTTSGSATVHTSASTDSGGTTSTGYTAPSVTTTVANTLIVAGFVGGANFAASQSVGISGTGVTADLSGTAAANGTGYAGVILALAHVAQAATGSSTSISASNTQNVEWGAATVALYDRPPPTAPGSITAPAVGATVTRNTSTAITWTAATTPNGDALVYDVELSLDGGVTFAVIASSVNALTTNYTFPTYTTQGRVRVRAKDTLGVYGPYATQTGNFAVDSPPNASSSLNPSGNVSVERASIQRLSWVFSDPDSGDTQSKFDVQWRQGTGSWTTVTQTTPNSFYDAPAATFPAGSIEWQVRTYDSLGTVGPWSASAFFTAGTTPGIPTITSPINGSTQATSTGTITWSSPAQDSYQVRKVADNAGSPNTSVVYYDTGEVVDGTSRTASLTFPTNSRTEHLEVRVKSGGLWSTWADVSVAVAYTPPATPTLLVVPDPLSASIYVRVTNPTPTGGQPAVTAQDVYRTQYSAPGVVLTRIRVAAGLAAGATYVDYTPASGVTYAYEVVAIGSTGATSISALTY